MHGDKRIFSVIVPAYNEEKTILTILKKLNALDINGIELDIIIVDDCSCDNTVALLNKNAHLFSTLKQHAKNQGKGAAIRTGFSAATGDYVAIQDADLEYNPSELVKMVQLIDQGDADVVLGSRFLSSSEHRVLYFWHYLGNKALTLLSNIFSDLNVSDMETCYKVFRRDKIADLTIEEDRFGFEPEIVAKIAGKKLRIYECGISYHGRTYEEGKKIGLKDAFRALYCIVKYNGPHMNFVAAILLNIVLILAFSIFNVAIFGVFRAYLPLLISVLLSFGLIYLFDLYVRILIRHTKIMRLCSVGAGFIILFSFVFSLGVDLAVFKCLMAHGIAEVSAKFYASVVFLAFGLGLKSLLGRLRARLTGSSA